MAQSRKLSPADLERLSAYMDRQLSRGETARLETRLQREPALAQALQDLQSVVSAVGSIEPVRLPRSFTLTPDMVGRRQSRSFPILQFATAVSALAFVALIGIDLFGVQGFSSQLASPANEPAQFESAPSLANEVQGTEGDAFSAAGEQAADAVAGETPMAAAAREAEAPLEEEGGIAEESLNFSPTPLPNEFAQELAAAPEPELYDETKSAAGATQLESGEDKPTPSVVPTEFSPVAPPSPGINSLRLGEILSGTLLFILIALFFVRRPRSS